MVPPDAGEALARVLLVDNYDSFTWNLVQAFRVLGADVHVVRNDVLTVEEALMDPASHLVLSPGPGQPRNAGMTLDLVERSLGRIPILGVCLGQQALAVALGGRVVRARTLFHGKDSLIQHDGLGLFDGLPNPLCVGRYHSLVIDESTLPAELEISARGPEEQIMAVRHRTVPAMGVQFHPESIMTPEGSRLLANFLRSGDRDSEPLGLG